MNMKNMIERSRQGDKDAEREIIDFFMPRVKVMACSTFINGWDTEDLVQTAAIIILKAVRTMDIKDGMNVEGYILQSVKNHFFNERAKAIARGYDLSIDYRERDGDSNNDEMINMIGSGKDTEEEYIDKCDMAAMRMAMKKLPDDDVKFILKVFSNDRGYITDYSRKSGISYNKCIRRKNKIIEKLRESMKNMV